MYNSSTLGPVTPQAMADWWWSSDRFPLVPDCIFVSLFRQQQPQQ
jgi:hypothetical protein